MEVSGACLPRSLFKQALRREFDGTDRSEAQHLQSLRQRLAGKTPGHKLNRSQQLFRCSATRGVHLASQFHQLLNLLKRSLLSESPLSGICFQGPIDDAKSRLPVRRAPKIENSDEDAKRFEITILLCKSSHKAAYAETTAGEGLVDVLFSFLTFPLGFIVKLLDKNSSIGCVDNLYRSVEKLSTGTDCFKSDEHKDMLLAPELAPYFGCSNSLLPYIEMVSGWGRVPGCYVCYRANQGTVGTDKCEHEKKHVSLNEMNPKRPTSKEVGGGFAKEKIKFMITDDLEIVPFSSLLSIQTAKELGLNFASLEERKVSIGETEALNLLKSCLTSQHPLSNVLLPNKQPKRKCRI